MLREWGQEREARRGVFPFFFFFNASVMFVSSQKKRQSVCGCASLFHFDKQKTKKIKKRKH